MIGTWSVTAAMAAAIVRGDGRYPSSDAWCSDTATAWQPPRSSTNLDISSAASYRRARSSAERPGARMSNRSRYTHPPPVLVLLAVAGHVDHDLADRSPVGDAAQRRDRVVQRERCADVRPDAATGQQLAQLCLV